MNINCTWRTSAARTLLCGVLAIGGLPAAASIARADDAADVAVHELTVRDGRFDPQTIEVEAGKPFQIRVTNADAAAIEFESFELHRERVVRPKETITVPVPALTADTYKFFDDFHADTPSGVIVAK
jgi:hypothetical protein